MIPAAFQYVKANSVAEALVLLQQHGEDAKLVAGGHSLLICSKPPNACSQCPHTPQITFV